MSAQVWPERAHAPGRHRLRPCGARVDGSRSRVWELAAAAAAGGARRAGLVAAVVAACLPLTALGLVVASLLVLVVAVGWR